jgi:hypothetical protein
MKMDKGNEKYDKVLGILRKAEPVLTSADEIAEKVMKTISRESAQRADHSEVLDFIFSWVYNVWVRRSLMAVAAVLVIVFIIQQGVILNQINQISRQINTSEWGTSAVSTRYPDKSILLFKFKSSLLPHGNKDISDKKVDDLLKSIDNLKNEYRDIQDMIEKDPELKKLIEKKLSEIDGNKIKL